MRIVTATEAIHSFAAILDDAEHGQTVVVTQGGRRIAMIGPAKAGNGAEVLALLNTHATDDGFADDVNAARAVAMLAGGAWPED